jgi:hypothetical protein
MMPAERRELRLWLDLQRYVAYAFGRLWQTRVHVPNKVRKGMWRMPSVIFKGKALPTTGEQKKKNQNEPVEKKEEPENEGENRGEKEGTVDTR